MQALCTAAAAPAVGGPAAAAQLQRQQHQQRRQAWLGCRPLQQAGGARLSVTVAAAGPGQQPEQQQQRRQQMQCSVAQRAAGGAVALLASAAVLLGAPGGQLTALAADSAKVGTCLLQNCQAALANCLTDGTCVANLVCLQQCNNAKDETACQIKCGDKYDDKAIATFNSCAVSEKKCVPQRVDKGLYPEPPECALDNDFDLSNFQGRWYITAGLNPLFDTFDCQEHYFASPEPGKVFAKINWRIPLIDPLDGDLDFTERSTMQRFVQDPTSPAKLYNHDNEYLHYQDDWYVLASKPDEYVFIYYRGQNDAWVGYGGATVYTKAASLPEEYLPELKAAAESAGLEWGQFTVTDNSCPPHPPERTVVQRLERGAEKGVVQLEYTVEDDLRSFGRGFTVFEKDLASKLRAGEEAAVQEARFLTQEARLVEAKLEEEARQAGRMLKRMEMEAGMGPWINWVPKSLRPVLMPIKDD